MRVYISVDMEGVAGVVHEDQTDPIDPRHAAEYNRMRRLMTAEANAAIEGALAAGAERVVVNDSHWLMMNLLAEELHPAAELLSGGPKPAAWSRASRKASMRLCSWAITLGPASVRPSSTTRTRTACTRRGSADGRSGSSRSTRRSPAHTGCRWRW